MARRVAAENDCPVPDPHGVTGARWASALLETPSSSGHARRWDWLSPSGCGSSSNRTPTRAALHDCRRGVADWHPAAGNRRPRPEIPYGAELTAVVEQLRPNRRADPTAGGNHAQPGAGRSPAGAPGCVSPLVRCGDDMDKLVVPLRW